MRNRLRIVLPEIYTNLNLKPGRLSKCQKIFGDGCPKRQKKFEFLSGELRQNIFQGTLDEIRPVLAQECAQSGLPALLLSEDEKRYSIVYPVTNAKMCTSNELVMKAEHSLLDVNSLYELEFCQSIKNLDL